MKLNISYLWVVGTHLSFRVLHSPALRVSRMSQEVGARTALKVGSVLDDLLPHSYFRVKSTSTVYALVQFTGCCRIAIVFG